MSEVRLIDADKLKEELKKYFSDGTLDSVSAKLAFNMILRKIDEAQTVKTYCYFCGQTEHGKIEEKPQGDLISRSKLLISILAMIGHYNEIVTQDKVLGWVYGVDNCRELIENAPTVKTYCYFCGQTEHGKIEESSKSKWIPVSERLPDKEDYIQCNGLFIVSDGNRVYAEHFDIYDKKCFGEPTIYGFKADRLVIAWQPLPEPYKKGDTE